jgi:hypothetical protein
MYRVISRGTTSASAVRQQVMAETRYTEGFHRIETRSHGFTVDNYREMGGALQRHPQDVERGRFPMRKG